MHLVVPPPASSRSATTWRLPSLRRWRDWLAAADSRYQDRENLSRVDERVLSDIGVSRADVDEELRRTD